MNDLAIAEQTIPRVAAREPIVTTELSESMPTTRVLYLDRGNVLRIIDGAGVRVTAVSGVVWLTEERVRADVVLSYGTTHVIQKPGKTVLLAHHPAWVVVQLPAGTATSRIEFAAREGRPGKPVVVRRQPVLLAARWCLTALARLAKYLANARSLGRRPVPYY